MHHRQIDLPTHPPSRLSSFVVFAPSSLRSLPWSTHECGRGHGSEITIFLLTTSRSSSSSLSLPRRWRRQQLSPLSAPCIPSPPSLFDCQMPRDDTVVAIFVVIASVISFLPPPSRPDNAAATPTTQWHTRRLRHPSRRRRPSNTTARLSPRRQLNNVTLTTPRHLRGDDYANGVRRRKKGERRRAYIIGH